MLAGHPTPPSHKGFYADLGILFHRESQAGVGEVTDERQFRNVSGPTLKLF